ncbi:MAG: sigma-54 dependent transcriptional regulator [Proteobacteria bacterium]|nr:sigma-54 dependent transcriptional regulator [Pseudomonadota bacterium]MBU4471465.1 sigma-54 dependent transcriptional regulator [Pseudomonadota bacterium]MCG2752471.1 sigma-54 dependent transcriptional regulator [Desulfobacteraceae bacterium]
MKSIPENTPILVIDDDDGLLLSIKTILLSADMPEPALLSDGRLVMEMMQKQPFHLVLLDNIMPHITGMDILKQIKEKFPETECIMVTAVDDVSTAVEAIKYGAYDYLVKPLNSEKLKITIHRALERYNLRKDLSLHKSKPVFSDLKNPEAFNKLIAEDESMALVFHQVEVVAPTDYSVMIIGESGTGKEELAGIIHRLSRRSKNPFVAVNMASFNRTLFEDEFFGHKKGAFTDAASDKEGFFEKADTGTLFLDEVSELELSLQSKLLRVIEEKELYRIGSTSSRMVDVRIVTATNRKIESEIEKGQFRKDLYYRLNTFSIKIPPLRDRKKDILPLALHFTNKHAKLNNKTIKSLSAELTEYLLDYSFPGNVREMENIIATSVLLEKSNKLCLSSAIAFFSNDIPNPKPVDNKLLTLDEVEKQHMAKVLKHAKGNRAIAAKILGVNITTVYRKLEKYGLSRDES